MPDYSTRDMASPGSRGMVKLSGSDEAGQLHGAIRSYVDARLRDVLKYISNISRDVAGQRKMILDQDQMIRDQKKQIGELRAKLSIVEWRTAPKSDKPVKL